MALSFFITALLVSAPLAVLARPKSREAELRIRK